MRAGARALGAQAPGGALTGRERWGARARFGALYLAEGAPIGFLWWFLPGRLRELGVPVADIAALTAGLAVPWAFKFLWSPLLDALRAPWWGYRHWMAAMQVIMVWSLLPLAVLDLRHDFGLVYACCLVHAVAAATQDVAIDAQAVASIPPDERGAINGWMQTGMLLGRAAFGGLAIRWAATYGLAPVVVALCAAVALPGASVLLLREPEDTPAGASAARFRGALASLLSRRWLLVLLFALVAGAGFEALGGLAQPFLVDRALPATLRGNFYAFLVVPAMVVGALAGGRLADRHGAPRAAGGGLVFLTGAVVAVACVTDTGTLLRAMVLLYFGIGLFTAASYTLFMNQTDPARAATQFTTCMAATNACEVGAVFAAGRLVPGFGYSLAFVTMAVVSLTALPILALPRLRRHAAKVTP